MGVTLHWTSADWKLKDLGLYFHLMEGPHTGTNICEAFIEILKLFDISDRVNINERFGVIF